jgi:putative membrane-bound dehydrogenase-like protein
MKVGERGGLNVIGAVLALLGLQGDVPGPELRVPRGWTIERVAEAPQVERPVLAAFDDRGGLYVIDSAGVNLKGSELLKDPPHRIRRLEDTDGDGRFDRSVVFADRLVFPQGLLWHDGAVYTPSPPGFWKLEDLDGDGVCDRRTELLTGFANTGVADDVHGACLGPDGRIYFLPGRMAHDLRTPDGRRIRKAVGPWLMRMRPDGSDIEIVSGAQGNPVEVDWLPEGDYFVSGTFWAPDSFGGGLRDALIHGVEGGEYPVRDRVYQDRVRTGDLLPVLVPMIATAPSGMAMVRGDREWAGSLLCTYFNTHRVQRHVLTRNGASFSATTEDLVVSEHPDFHPTDVLEDADGSFLVVDTGGWFRIGCPTSQVAKPQVLGAIYRLRRAGTDAVKDPWGLQADWQDKVARLEDPRWQVREAAIARLRDPADLERALARPEGRTRLNAVWAAARREDPKARSLVRKALTDAEAGVRQAAATVAGLHRDTAAESALIALLDPVQPAQVRREAATALGRIGKGSNALLGALKSAPDRFLEHAILFALIRVADAEALKAALNDESPAVRRGALIALDQVPGELLSAEQVLPLLDPSNPALLQEAFRVVARKPAWSQSISGLAREWLARGPDEIQADLLRGVIVAFGRESHFQELLAATLREPSTPPASRRVVLETLPRAAPERWPSIWLAELRWSLEHPDPAVVRQALAAIRASGTGDFDAVLAALARDGARPVELRLEAAQAVSPRLPALDAPLHRFLLDGIDPAKPPLIRLAAADALGRAPLDDAQLNALLARLPKAGPLELPRLAGAYERTGNVELLKRWAKVLADCGAVESLPAELLRRVGRKGGPPLQEALAPLLKRIEVDAAGMKARMEQLAPALAGGDAVRGRSVFLGPKSGCTACHTVQGQGGRVGPDLSKIGSIRSSRDLLEAVVFPSATFARGFEPVLIRTRDGGVLDGIVARETADAIVLFTAERSEKRIPREAIAELRESRVSVMPQGLDAQIGTEELRDLIAYLASLK